jgi:hypothetical protein
MNLAQLMPIVGLLGMGGCATPPPIPDRATFLGQISYIARPDEVAQGFHFIAQPDEALNGVLPHSRDVPPAKHLIEACGAEHSADANFVLVRFYYYQVGRSGRLDDYSHWAVLEDGLLVERGNLVELEQRPGQGKSRCLVTSKILSATLAAAGCEYHRDQQGALFSALEMVSGQASASLYCPFLEAEGWKSAQVGLFGGLAWWKPTLPATR